jgi:hypothetical protein
MHSDLDKQTSEQTSEEHISCLNIEFHMVNNTMVEQFRFKLYYHSIYYR